MGEIGDVVKLYVDKEVLPEFTDQFSKELQQNIKDVIAPGNPGYDTGHLHDSIYETHSVSDGTALIVAGYTPDYGLYVDQGHHSWKGVNFMQRGLEATLALYGV